MPGFSAVSHLLRFMVLCMTMCSATAFQVSLARFYQHRTAGLWSDCQNGSGSEMSHWQSFGFAVLQPAVPFGCHRWGEALHPGPHDGVSTIVQFGFSNPSGLRKKEEIAVGLGPGIWSFSETHLSQVTQRSCASSLKQLAAAAGRDLKVHLGAPVAPRPHSEWA